MKTMPMTRDEFKDMVGEGFHTAFRKATQCAEADAAWLAITGMPGANYEAVVEFVTRGFETTYAPLEWKP